MHRRASCLSWYFEAICTADVCSKRLCLPRAVCPPALETNQPRGFAFVEFEQVAASLGNAGGGRQGLLHTHTRRPEKRGASMRLNFIFGKRG